MNITTHEIHVKKGACTGVIVGMMALPMFTSAALTINETPRPPSATLGHTVSANGDANINAINSHDAMNSTTTHTNSSRTIRYISAGDHRTTNTNISPANTTKTQTSSTYRYANTANTNTPDDGVNYRNILPASVRTAPIKPTLQEKIYGPDGELLATQPGAVEIVETIQADNIGPIRLVTPMPPAIAALQHDLDSVDSGIIPPNRTIRGVSNSTDVPTNLALTPYNNSDYTPLLSGERPLSQGYGAAQMAVPVTLKHRITGADGEYIATQPGEVEVQESRRVVRP